MEWSIGKNQDLSKKKKGARKLLRSLDDIRFLLGNILF